MLVSVAAGARPSRACCRWWGGRPVPARAVVRIARTGGVLLVLITLHGVLNSIFGFAEQPLVLIGRDLPYPQPGAWANWLYLPATAWGFLVLAVAGDYAWRTAGRDASR
ncbi:hypothetical protein [Streptomyces sp. NPDC048623]|uniref:hypothetical protein n=1 Tax=Streptomyces sp. NPDC048623 TaxID=3155761 RepID=UPI003428B3A7